MSDVQELKERLGRLEDKFSRTEQRFTDGEQQFKMIATGIDDIKEHLKKQDEVIDTTNNSIGGILAMWEGGIKGVQLACRVSKGWDWLVAQTLSKRGLALAALFLIIFRVVTDHWPVWLKYLIIFYKTIEGVTL